MSTLLEAIEEIPLNANDSRIFPVHLALGSKGVWFFIYQKLEIAQTDQRLPEGSARLTQITLQNRWNKVNVSKLAASKFRLAAIKIGDRPHVGQHSPAPDRNRLRLRRLKLVVGDDVGNVVGRPEPADDEGPPGSAVVVSAQPLKDFAGLG